MSSYVDFLKLLGEIPDRLKGTLSRDEMVRLVNDVITRLARLCASCDIVGQVAKVMLDMSFHPLVTHQMALARRAHNKRQRQLDSTPSKKRRTE